VKDTQTYDYTDYIRAIKCFILQAHTTTLIRTSTWYIANCSTIWGVLLS